MKKILTILLAAAALSSCVDDNTNESFQRLNEVTIEGIEDEYDDVGVDEPFSIHPTVTTSLGTEDGLRYYWIAYDNSTRLRPDTLSRQKDLDVTIALTPGQHTMKMKAEDTRTGVFWEREFTVNVVNEFTSGMMLLAERDGNAMLDFYIPAKSKLVEDVYGKMNDGAVLGQKPLKVQFNKYYTDQVSEVMVLCQDGKGGCVLDNITMTHRRDYADLFLGGAPDNLNPQAYYKCYMRDYLVNDGRVYDRAVNSTVPDVTFKPALSVRGGADYQIAADADFNDNASVPDRAVLYDNLNQCFYTIQNVSTAFLTTAKATSGVTYVDGGCFNPDAVGMTCVFAGLTSRSSTGGREYLGVFENASGERRLLRCGIGFWTDDDPSTYFRDLANDALTCEGIASATTFTTSPLFSGYLFYVVGGRVYAYNSLSGASGAVYDLSQNSSLGISCVIDRIEMEQGSSRMWVAFRDTARTSRPAGFVVLDVSTDGGLTLTPSFSRTGVADRIADFELKY